MSTACHEAGLARKRVLGKSRSISLVPRYASCEILQEPFDSSALILAARETLADLRVAHLEGTETFCDVLALLDTIQMLEQRLRRRWVVVARNSEVAIRRADEATLLAPTVRRPS